MTEPKLPRIITNRTPTPGVGQNLMGSSLNNSTMDQQQTTNAPGGFSDGTTLSGPQTPEQTTASPQNTGEGDDTTDTGLISRNNETTPSRDGVEGKTQDVISENKTEENPGEESGDVEDRDETEWPAHYTEEDKQKAWLHPNASKQ